MNQIKRPILLVGLIITTCEILLFIITQLIFKYDDVLVKIIFWVCVVILIFNINSFYTVNLTAKEFKKKIYLPWTSFGLIFIYSIYLLAVIIMSSHNGIDSNDTLIIGNFFIIVTGTLLYIPGILKKIIDDKITYEEHSSQSKNEEE